jgi:sulfotransferase family protein
MTFRALRKAKASIDAAAGALSSKTSKAARRRIALKDAQIAALRHELARAKGDGRMSPAPATPVFFVVGNQKSGTTWLMRTLDAHPEILCKGEGRFFGATWRQRGLKQREVQRPASSLYNAILDAEYLKLWVERSVWSRSDNTYEHLNNLTRMAITYFLEGELLKSGKRIVGDKSPLLTPDTLHEISEIYPEAKVLHIVRDGRDVTVSALYHSWNFGKAGKREAHREDSGEPRVAAESLFEGNHLRKLAADWAARVGKTIEDAPALLGENYAEVRYENLLARPEEEVQHLLRFLGVEANAETVGRCVEAASFEKLSRGRKRGEENPSSFFRKGVAGDWKSVFTERDKLVFKQEAGDLLVRLGYERGEDW